MSRVIIDTNAILSFVTDRNPKQQEQVAALFEQAARLKTTVICHHHVINEFVYVLTSVYDTPATAIRDMLMDFAAMPGIELASETHLSTILKHWPEPIADFGDALLASLCMNSPKTAICTFDRTFKHTLKKLKVPVYEWQ